MMFQVDKYTKAVLTIIAAALVAIALRGNVTAAKADEADDISSMASDISDIKSDVSSIQSDVSDISAAEAAVAGGTCNNDKIC